MHQATIGEAFAVVEALSNLDSCRRPMAKCDPGFRKSERPLLYTREAATRRRSRRSQWCAGLAAAGGGVRRDEIAHSTLVAVRSAVYSHFVRAL